MKEAKILSDMDYFNYWKSNLNYQENLKDSENIKR